MKTALLIVDVQNDYFIGGKMELHNSSEAAIRTEKLLKLFRQKKLPVVFIQHISLRPGASFFLPDTPGAEINETVKPEPGEKIIIKHFPNSFRETSLDPDLKKDGISRLVIAGMMTHMCIDTTVRAAFDLGYECIVPGDCCATKALNIENNTISAENVQLAFLAALNGSFARVIRSDEVSKHL